MTDETTTGAPRRRPDASMSLLTDVLLNPVDSGYAEAAARRHASETSGNSAAGAEPRRRHVWLAICLAALGVLLATAAAQVRDRAPAVARTNQALLAEI